MPPNFRESNPQHPFECNITYILFLLIGIQFRRWYFAPMSYYATCANFPLYTLQQIVQFTGLYAFSKL